MKCRLFILSVFFMALSVNVYAAEAVKIQTPVTKLDDASKEMLEGLNENQTKQFAAIRSSHGIIRAVEETEKTIKAASKSCSQHNPEFAQTMQKRVGEWNADIDPILVNARARLNEMIKLQSFTSSKDVHAYLKKIDDAVAFKSKSMKSIPVTEKKECKKLLGKMDDTQEDLKKLMIENLGLDKPLKQKTE